LEEGNSVAAGKWNDVPGCWIFIFFQAHSMPADLAVASSCI